MPVTLNHMSITQDGNITGVSSRKNTANMLDKPVEMGTFMLRRAQYFSRRVYKADLAADADLSAHFNSANNID